MHAGIRKRMATPDPVGILGAALTAVLLLVAPQAAALTIIDVGADGLPGLNGSAGNPGQPGGDGGDGGDASAATSQEDSELVDVVALGGTGGDGGHGGDGQGGDGGAGGKRPRRRERNGVGDGHDDRQPCGQLPEEATVEMVAPVGCHPVRGCLASQEWAATAEQRFASMTLTRDGGDLPFLTQAAVGGHGGDGASGGQGGNAQLDLSITTTGIHANTGRDFQQVVAGNGGDANASSPGVGGDGGDAILNASATATGDSDVDQWLQSFGGDGGASATGTAVAVATHRPS